MNLKERAFDTSKKLAKPAALFGAIALTVASRGYLAETKHDPDINISPIAQAQETEHTELYIKPPMADHLPIPATDQENVSLLLNNPSKELTLTEYGDVFDYYFKKAMENFKWTGKRNDPISKTDGTAIFTTNDGYKYTLSRNHIPTGYVIQMGQSQASEAIERTINIQNTNKLPEYPGIAYNLSVKYAVVENRKPERTVKLLDLRPEVIL